MSFKITFLIVILVFISGCIQNSSTFYSKNGISLICPEKWLIKEKSIENSNTINCEKIGTDESGLVSMVWIDHLLNPSEMLQKVKPMLKSLSEYNFSNLQEIKFKEYKAVEMSYNFWLSGIENKENIITFNCNNKTIVMIFHEATEDHQKNLPGFEIIKNSFYCGEK